MYIYLWVYIYLFPLSFRQAEQVRKKGPGTRPRVPLCFRQVALWWNPEGIRSEACRAPRTEGGGARPLAYTPAHGRALRAYHARTALLRHDSSLKIENTTCSTEIMIECALQTRS